ncbi:MAG: tripartite tricarboxylate transporter substrate binding protein [Pseudomonadota bacterium]
MRRRDVLGMAAAGVLPCAGLVTAAGGWPSQPLRLLVAYPPGGVSDEVARRLAQGLRERLGMPVIVEHRAGAGGAVAMEALARASADGHTLCFSAISPLVYAPLFSPLPYDPLRDFQPVMAVMHTPVLVLAAASFAADSFGQALALARAAPRQLRWATSGQATVGHMVLEQVSQAAEVEFTHVPYKGGGQQLNDALGGQFELLSSNLASQQIQYVKQGRLKALALGSPQRAAALPDVPTLAELGFASANLVSTFGIFAPRRIAPERLALLNAALNALVADSELRDRLNSTGNLPGGGTPEDFARQIAREREAGQRLKSPRR